MDQRRRRPLPATVSVLLALVCWVVLPPAPGAASPVDSSGTEPITAGSAVPGGLMVTAEPGADLPAILAGRGHGEVTVIAPDVARVVVAPGREDATVADLLTAPGVGGVERERYRALPQAKAKAKGKAKSATAVSPDDPRVDEQWSHTVARAPRAWSATTGSRDVRVAVVDSGIDARHPDLGPNVVMQADASTGRVRVTAPHGGIDNDTCGSGHGTLVAGVLGAVGDNGVGIAGVAWDVSIVDIAITSDEGVPRCVVPDSAVLAALVWATTPEQRVDVVNLSLSAPEASCPLAYQRVIDAATAAGIVVVAAAGNTERSFPGEPNVPAACNGVISVGAANRSPAPAPYSSVNGTVDLLGPGGQAGEQPEDTGSLVLTTAAGGGYAAVQGTSFASPYVAGVAALVRSVAPELTPAQVESVLESTARDLESAGRDPGSGWGLVQADGAVARAADGEPVPDPVPDEHFPVAAPALTRVAHGSGSTRPVEQAVAVSHSLFDAGEARHVLLTRGDVFADALAGSSLGYGAGPLLFATSDPVLPAASRHELQRVLPAGGLVYVLGGPAAVPAGVVDEVSGLGYRVVRLAGGGREATARIVAEELGRRLPELGGTPPSAVALATRDSWPDAVSAGSLGARFGIPVLLTDADGLHPEAAAAIADVAPDTIYLVGGAAALSDDVRVQAAEAAGLPVDGGTVRLSGPSRVETAVAVAREMLRLLDDAGVRPQVAVAANVRREDAFAHLLSAAPMIGHLGGVFVPVEGDSGAVLPDAAAALVCRLRVDAVVAGDVDIVGPAVADRLVALLGGDC